MQHLDGLVNTPTQNGSFRSLDLSKQVYNAHPTQRLVGVCGGGMVACGKVQARAYR